MAPTDTARTTADTGRLRELSTGPFEWWSDDGRIIEVQPCDAPLETPLEVLLDGDCIVEWARDRSQPAAYVDETRKHVAFIALTDSTDPDQVKRIGQRMQETCDYVVHHKRWAAQEDWDVQGWAVVLQVDDVSRYGLSGPWNELMERFAEIHPGVAPNYKMMFGPNTSSGSAAGEAYISSGTGLVRDVGNERTACHELGHMFGCGHSATRSEYGGDDWMGNAFGYNAVHLDLMGLLESHRVTTARLAQSGAFILGPPEAGDLALPRGMLQIAYLMGEDRNYSISLRGREVVVIASRGAVPIKPPWRGTETIDTLRVGDSVTLEGQTIHYRAFDRAAAAVTVGDARAPAFPTLKLPDEVAPMAGVAGTWFHRGYTHQGLEVFERDGGITIAWYTWAEHGPSWIIGNGPIVDNIAHLTLTAPDPKTRSREQVTVGDAKFYCHGPDRGVLKYVTTFSDRYWPGRGVLQLDRLTRPVAHELYGMWDYAGTENEGISVHVVWNERAQEHQLIAYDWTYERGPMSRPTWYLVKGRPGETLEILKPVGGLANTRTKSRLDRWGEATITNDRYTYQKDGWKQAKTHELVEML